MMAGEIHTAVRLHLPVIFVVLRDRYLLLSEAQVVRVKEALVQLAYAIGQPDPLSIGVDTFGTADEDRWWDAAAYEKGGHVELSKEFVRQYYRGTGYHKALMDARAAKTPEPDIPALPADVVKRVSELYVGLFERLTGETFR